MDLYTLNAIPQTELVDLFRRKYGEEPYFNLTNHIFQEALRISKEQHLYASLALYEGSQLQGHIALFQPLSASEKTGYFGFLEALSPSHLDPLWTTLCNQASQRGFTHLWGPLNATPWHQYRTITSSDGSPFFQTEPFSDIQYGHFLEHKGVPFRFYSAYRTQYQFLVEKTENAYERIVNTNISLTRSSSLTRSTLHTLWSIIQNTFGEQTAFLFLSLEDFQKLYEPSLFSPSLFGIYILKDGDTPIGYLSSFWRDSSTLLIKTIAILPSYQGQGLGNVLTHAVHKDALQNNIQTITYGLIREGNAIRHFPTDHVTIFRQYAMFYSSL